MHWSDLAIILSTKHHGEHAGVLTVFSGEHGLCKGYVRSIRSSKSRGIYQPGNVVHAAWSGRLMEHLGNFSCELMEPFSAYVLAYPKKLAALSAMCALLERTLPEREAHPELFLHFKSFLTVLSSDLPWESHYVRFEMMLLQQLGFGLDLESCAATGTTDNLVYVSPKSGRAVCQTAGEPYKDKLFMLPSFLTNGQEICVNTQEIRRGLALCEYFLNKYIFQPHRQTMPLARERLAELLTV